MNGFQRVCKYQMNRTLKRMPFIILWIILLKFINYRFAFPWIYLCVLGPSHLYTSFSRTLQSGISRKNILKSIYLNNILIIVVSAVVYTIMCIFLKNDFYGGVYYQFDFTIESSALIFIKSILFFGNILLSVSLISFANSRLDIGDRLVPAFGAFFTIFSFMIIFDDFITGKVSIPLLLALSCFGVIAHFALRHGILEADDR